MPDRDARGHILVVDDDDGVRRLFTDALALAGYATVAADSVAAAAAVLEAGEPEVICVVLDDHLPDGRGIDLLRRMRTRVGGETVPVIVVTGDDDPQAELDGLQAGATDHLRKPVSPESLVARVATHLRDRATWLTMLAAVTDRRPPAGRVDSGAVGRLIDAGAFHPVFQPIVDLVDGQCVGYEALTRFDDGTNPERWFDDALAAGVGPELELATLTAAISAARDLPGGGYVSVNVTPGLLAPPTTELASLLATATCPIVLEITEREAIDDYDVIRTQLASLRPSVRLSIDDAGAGFASLRHVLMLEPDFVKLDRTWVSGIDAEPTKQAMVAGLVHFADATGCELIAEGVETPAEREMLARLGVPFAQGYLLGHPEPAR